MVQCHTRLTLTELPDEVEPTHHDRRKKNNMVLQVNLARQNIPVSKCVPAMTLTPSYGTKVVDISRAIHQDDHLLIGIQFLNALDS